MNTLELSYQEMKKIVTEKGITTTDMKKETLAAAIATFEAPKTETRGRKVDPNSARQLRLAKVGTVKRGRPEDPNSAWNKKQAELAAKREAGILSQGRPVNPESARQIRLREMSEKRAAGLLKRGRPAAVKTEETVAA